MRWEDSWGSLASSRYPTTLPATQLTSTLVPIFRQPTAPICVTCAGTVLPQLIALICLRETRWHRRAQMRRICCGSAFKLSQEMAFQADEIFIFTTAGDIMPIASRLGQSLSLSGMGIGTYIIACPQL